MRLLRFATLLMLALGIVACQKKPDDVLKMGIISPSINHLPLSYALEATKTDSSKVKIQYFSSGWEVQEALIAGQIDSAIMPFSYAWNAAAKGYPVKIVSFLERETDGIVAKNTLKTIADLNGKKIGLLKASTVELFLIDLANAEKLSYEAVYFRTPNELVAALTSDEVNAIVAYVPVIQKIPEGFEALHWFGDSHQHHPCCDIVVNNDELDSSKTAILKSLIKQIDSVLPSLNRQDPIITKYIAEKYGLTTSQVIDAMQHTYFATGLDTAGKNLERSLAKISVQKGYQARQLKDDEIYLELK